MPNIRAYFLIALMLALVTGPARAEPADSEPTRARCDAAVKAARELAETLPKDSMSRLFAERELEQAMAEAGNGEFDDCVDYADQAAREVRDPHHQVPASETAKLRKAGQ